ncbi:MAG: hypothetical protein RLZZ58_154 [Pseudomonadota bacterium]
MTFQKKDAAIAATTPAVRFTPAAEKLFLEKLSVSANVTASAKAAGVATSAVYRRRAASPAFCKGWERALAAGYARLEAELLAQALTRVNGQASDKTIRAQAQKQRLGMALLAAHRAAVRGSTPVTAAQPAGTARERVTAKLMQMQARLHPAPDMLDEPDGDVDVA